MMPSTPEPPMPSAIERHTPDPSVDVQAIPPELRGRRQWVTWRGERRPDGALNKVPCDPITPARSINAHDPRNWMTVEQAVEHAPDTGGVGFVLTADDPYAIVDLDHVLDEAGTIASRAPHAREIVNLLDSYTEITPSGRGLHVIVRATLPPGRRQATGIEVYDQHRFITVTGTTFEGRNEIRDRQAELENVFRRFIEPQDTRGGYMPPERIPQGQRHNHLVRLAGWFRAKGLTPNEIDPTLLEVNRTRCLPPLPENEVRGIAQSTAAWPPKANVPRSQEGEARNGQLQDNSRPPRLYNARELLADDFVSPVDFVVDGLLPVGGLSLWIARPFVAKSTTLRAASVAVAQGRDFLGWHVKPGTTLYLALEGHRARFVEQLKALGLCKEDPFFLAFDLGERMLDNLERWVREHDVRLVVVDTLQRLVRLTDTSDYAQAIDRLGGIIRLAQETGAHLACAHHANKREDTGTVESALGSVGIAGSFDVVVRIRKDDKGQRFLSVVSKVAEEVDERLLALEGPWPTLGAERREAVEQVLADHLLAHVRANPGVANGDLLKAVGGDWTAKIRMLAHLADETYLDRQGAGRRGDPYRYWPGPADSLFRYADTRPQRNNESVEGPETDVSTGSIRCGSGQPTHNESTPGAALLPANSRETQEAL